MRTNQKPTPAYTHEGARASIVSPEDELRRTILACLLWESNFYESGESVAERIKRLVPRCQPEVVSEIAIEARQKRHLRHAPLLLARELARDSARCAPGLISKTVCDVVQRADELAEFLAIYWTDGKTPIAKQVKKGLACAFQRFNEYQLAKYNRDNVVKLRDVMFMVHPKPRLAGHVELWKRLAEGRLATPDTWEVLLSSGADKKEVFERLLRENKLGYLALLRNLRNMQQAGVDERLVFARLMIGAAESKALPFRFIAAARAVPAWESVIDEAMQIALQGIEKLPGKTALLVDVSGSMDHPLSSKSDLSRMDVAAALAVLLRGICESVRVFTFSKNFVEVPPRNGMALADAVISSQPHDCTYLGQAITRVAKEMPDASRLIVFTDEQSHDPVGNPHCKGYMVNVASYQNGVGYGSWLHINGFSESVVSYIAELEKTSIYCG